MRVRSVVLGSLVAVSLLLWATSVWAGGWAPVDQYVSQGTITFRGLLKLALILCCVGAVCYFGATQGFGMQGLQAMAGVGMAAIFILAVMFPIIDSIAEGATLDGQRLPCAGPTVTIEDATLGKVPVKPMTGLLMLTLVLTISFKDVKFLILGVAAYPVLIIATKKNVHAIAMLIRHLLYPSRLRSS